MTQGRYARHACRDRSKSQFSRFLESEVFGPKRLNRTEARYHCETGLGNRCPEESRSHQRGRAREPGCYIVQIGDRFDEK